MARTHKDLPIREILNKSMRAGKIDHDHTLPKGMVRHRWSKVPELSGDFLKSQTVEIAAYRAWLLKLGDKYRFTEVEKEPLVVESLSLNPAVFYEGAYIPRAVSFTVELKGHTWGWSAYCTDWEHYDPSRNVDIRDGLTPTCSPERTHEYYRRLSERARRKAHSSSKRRGDLLRAAKAYNSGADLEELDDLPDRVYYEFKSKTYID